MSRLLVCVGAWARADDVSRATTDRTTKRRTRESWKGELYDFTNLRPHLPNFPAAGFYAIRRFFAAKNRRAFAHRRAQQNATVGRPKRPFFIFVLDLEIYIYPLRE